MDFLPRDIRHVLVPCDKSDCAFSAFAEGERLAATLGAALEVLYVYEREQLDRVIMGTHGRTGFKRMLLGSVADRVLRECDRPVLTVGEHAYEHDARHAA